jgi:asparagine synthase (glutamine-hydrolysing)
MCGIAGIMGRGSLDFDLLRRMTDILSHRGPDDFGYVAIDTKDGKAMAFGKEILDGGKYNLGLGHRRLSIIDLSPLGHQPMSIEDGKFWIVYNGEVYNYLEIGNELISRGYHFKSRSDTEVILYAYVEWGEKCIERFNGMFSFVIWDGYKKHLFGVRDRFGEKPFYYYKDSKRFLFASEIKALMQAEDMKRIPNDSIVYDYLSIGIHDHTEDTFFRGIRQLLPGHSMIISRDLGIRITRYWELTERDVDIDNFYEDFRMRFKRAVKIRLRSDVRVGSCLSGGLDSSAVVCMVDELKKENGAPSVGDTIETFSSCFDDPVFDERRYIDEVINKTTSVRNYVFPLAENFWSEINALIKQQDEPFGSASVYAQWCLMRRAKETGVKVLLDGQGGDELLAGYMKFYYFYLLSLLKKGNPFSLVRELTGILSRGDKGLFDVKAAKRYIPGFIKRVMPNIVDILEPGFGPPYSNRKLHIGAAGTFIQRQILDLSMSSVPALVRYEDRNSMAFSVETRLPFLDFEFAERVVNYPPEYKIRSGQTKHVMREALRDILPPQIRQRKTKLGFVTPQMKWMRWPLRNKIGEILYDPAPRASQYIDYEKMRAEWTAFCQGKSSISDKEIFRVVVLELWMREFSI